MKQKLSPRRRALSLLLALSLIFGLLPGSAFAAGAAKTAAEPEPAAVSNGHWASSYLNQLMEWGFIRADQAKDPDRPLTRADFMSIVNRAYGYHETGPTPFEDITEYDWFYDDVGIAYNAGYIEGTSPTTASPNDELNRQTAATILGRNMMLQESPGEMTEFSDARDIDNWARGTIKSSMEHYLVTGYDDGTFKPKKSMTWGEIAAMVSRTIGTPLQDAGDYALGGVFGNVTITSPGVTLRDTVVSGDLYISGGVGLGGVKLENVTVLGRIIASGTGASEGGASILLRNVSADELLVDNLRGNEVSIQADGITEIGKTTVRTSAYIADNTPEGMGLHMISLEGDYYGEDEAPPEGWKPAKLTLAGRIEEVVNRTPDTTVHVAKGTVAKLTVDETAEGSHVIIDRGAVVKNLVLDAGIDVTGEGDITHLEVNAPGANVEMLPDEIVIRPGITATIAGHEMDSASAEEFLLDPMILAGYPKAQDIAPTSLEAVFAGNKQGRIYWAVSAITDGSIGAEDLLKPPSYGNKAVRWGTVDLPRGNEEVTAKITGLTSNGEYYLSAVLEDAKGQLSPVKVISFTTPDNTVPAFNKGYPYMSKKSAVDSVVVASVTKDCKLYYALLPAGVVAPTEADFRANAVAGALGFGIVDMQKNIEAAFRVNDQVLEEKKNYVLYLWLVDADGINKSAVVSLPFTTDDDTPPYFVMGPEVSNIQATSVGLQFQLSENGTVYWVAVPAGTAYPKPQPGTEFPTAPLTSDYAKLQVASGMNVGPNGKFGRVTATEGVIGTINVTGLKAEQAYDFYYLAKDNAGPDRNYSVEVGMITIYTLDTSGPKFSQHFSNPVDIEKDWENPMADTAVYLDVNENVRYSGPTGGRGFRELYEDIATGGDAARNKLAENLYQSIKLWKVVNGQGVRQKSKYELKDASTDWVIDYTQVEITAREGGIRIAFPRGSVKLENGARYYFTVEKITDTSNAFNPLRPGDPDFIVDFFTNPGNSSAAGHKLPVFRVEYALVRMSEVGINLASSPVYTGFDAEYKNFEKQDDGTNIAVVNKSFRLQPLSTSTAAEDVCYDILLWANGRVEFDLYYRVLDANGKTIHTTADNKGSYPSTYQQYLLPSKNNDNADKNGWIYIGESRLWPNTNKYTDRKGVSINHDTNLINCGKSNFPKLQNLSDDLIYEFAISIKSYDTQGSDPGKWDGSFSFYVNVIAGSAATLEELTQSVLSPAEFENYRPEKVNENSDGRSIGRDVLDANSDEKELKWKSNASSAPGFYDDYPHFSTTTEYNSGKINVYMEMDAALDNAGTLYYAFTETQPDKGGNLIGRLQARRLILDDELTRVTDPDKIPWVDPTSKTEIYVTANPPDGIDPAPERGNTNTSAMPNWMKGVGEGNQPTDTATSADSDDPGLTNAVTAPDSQRISDREGRQDNTLVQPVKSHTWADEKEIGSSMPTEKVENLKPSTDYFAYLVTQSTAGDNSHLYIYHFRTKPTPPLSVSIRRDATRGGADVWTNRAANNVRYVVVTKEVAAAIKLLNVKLADREDTKSLPTEYADYTVLDAMKKIYSNVEARSGNLNSGAYFPGEADDNEKTYNEGGYSVFDLYVGESLRRDVYNLILLTNDPTDNSTFLFIGEEGGRHYTTGGGDENADTPTFPDMSPEQEYIILAFAVAPPSPDEPDEAALRAGFKAETLMKADAGHPDLEDDPDGASTAGGLRATVDKSKPMGYAFSGSIYLHFTGDLYEYNKPDTKVDGEYFKNSRQSGGDAIVDRVEGADKRWTLYFSNLSVNETIEFVGGRFANSTNAQSPEPLKITLKYESGDSNLDRDEDGKPKSTTYYYLVVEWGDSTNSEHHYKRIPLDKFEIGEILSEESGNASVTKIVIKNGDDELKKSTVMGYHYDLVLPTKEDEDYVYYVNLTAVLTTDPEDGAYSGNITWETSDKEIVTVSPATGKTVEIAGVGVGTADITVTAGAITRKIFVTVKATAEARLLTESANVKWDSATNHLTLTSTSGNANQTSPSAKFELTAEPLDLSGNIKIVPEVTGKTADGRKAAVVKCEVDNAKRTITIRHQQNGTATVKIKVFDDKGQLLLTEALEMEVTAVGGMLNTSQNSGLATLPNF